MRHKIIRFLGLLIVILAVNTDAWACVCDRSIMKKTLLERAKEKFSSHGLVFEGKVISEYLDTRFRLGSRKHVYVFQVNHTYKGTAQGTIEIQTGFSDCAARFSTGQTYLVYASKRMLRGDFVTSLCSGNQNVKTVGADLRFLRGIPPEKNDFLTMEEYYSQRVTNAQQESGLLCGRVLFGTTDAIPRHRLLYLWPKRPWDGWIYPFIRDIAPDGTFCEEVPPAKYQVSALSFDSPQGVRSAVIYGNAINLPAATLVNVHPQEKVTDIDLQLLPRHATAIRGIVKVGDRPPLPDEKITVWLHSFQGDSLQLRRKVRADTVGRFEFQKVPVGFFELYAAYEGPNNLNVGSTSKAVATLHDISKIQLTLPHILR